MRATTASRLGFATALALCAAPGPRAAGAPLYPDIVEQISHLQVQNEHQREMLRFSTNHINLGDGPLQVRGGGQVAPCSIDGVAYAQCTHATQEVLDAGGGIALTHAAGVAFFHPQHNHWHQSAVARFEVRDADGQVVAGGLKETFCLVDNDKTPPAGRGGRRAYFDCNRELQGISVGWSDGYNQAVHGQELDITGIPEGTYYLVHAADPENHWLESREDNNFAWVKFQLVRQGANPKIVIVDRSPCEGAACGTPSNP